MNIWLINHYAVPPRYYPLARTACFAKYLVRAGHEVTIFAASSVHNSSINLVPDKVKFLEQEEFGINYVYVGTDQYTDNGAGRIKNMFQFAWRLPGVCINFSHPDVIMASSATPLACMAGIKLARIYGCKCIAEISDLWPESFAAYGLIHKKNPLMIPLYAYEKRLYKMADKIIFTMEGGRDYIIEKSWDKGHGGPVDLNKVFHINNGVDLEVFDKNKEQYILEDDDLSDEHMFKVIYTGSVRLVNKLDKLLETAKLTAGYNVRFLVWGAGDQLDNLIKRSIEEKIDNVVFKGHVDKKYIPYITSKAQLNIIFGENMMLFRYGGSMNKMFDYFASGKPTLFTFKMSYSLVERYKAGIELEDSSPKSIAEGILYFKNLSPEYYGTYCKNARKACEDYNFLKLTDSLMDIIDDNSGH